MWLRTMNFLFTCEMKQDLEYFKKRTPQNTAVSKVNDCSGNQSNRISPNNRLLATLQITFFLRFRQPQRRLRKSRDAIPEKSAQTNTHPQLKLQTRSFKPVAITFFFYGSPITAKKKLKTKWYV